MTESEDDNIILPADEGGRIARIMHALELTQGVEIARRYLAMNAFDGALTMLGLILGGLFTINPLDPTPGFNAIILAAVGTNIAMAISGFSGSYLAERAERDREVDDLGKAMLTDMSESLYAKASRTTSIVVTIVDGSSSAIAGFLVIMPLLLVPMGILHYQTAFYIGIGICMLLLFLLGLFLGSISKKNIWSYGAKTLLAGILTAIMMILISWLTGASH